MSRYTHSQDNHLDAAASIEAQYSRLLSDIEHALQVEKQGALKSLDNAKHVFQATTQKYLQTNTNKVRSKGIDWLRYARMKLIAQESSKQ